MSLVLVSCNSGKEAVPGNLPPPPPNKIILMIGDGMGLAQISAGWYQKKDKFNMTTFPVVGFQMTHSLDNLITDSAAGATAMSCGEKTYNSAIGLNADSIPCRTLVEHLHDKGFATGIVATAPITHATPAAFYAHQSHRVLFEDIALDLVRSDLDFFVGGGKRYFDRRSSDNRNLIEELRDNDFRIFTFLDNRLEQFGPRPDKKFGFFTADSSPLPVSAGRDYLTYATRLALKYLERRSEEGSFLLVEGSQIDWGGHNNELEYMINETLDFDRAVGEALRYAIKDQRTLVIVTADHESGGLAIMPGQEADEFAGRFTTNSHTANMVPVFAFGPGAELFQGTYDNTEIHSRILMALAGHSTLALEPNIKP